MKKSHGFSLIEIMVVLVIIAILAAIIVPKVMSRPDQARMVNAREDVMAIQNAMDMYRLDNGFYPTTDQGIQALVAKPNTPPIPMNWEAGGYLQQMPVDPWGQAYHYVNPGQHGSIDIYSYGPSGQPGTSDNNTIIGNWNTNQTPGK